MSAFDEIENVILLTTIMRQNDPRQEMFRQLLNRLRVGQSTVEDYNILKTRFYSVVQNHEHKEFDDAIRLSN